MRMNNGKACFSLMLMASVALPVMANVIKHTPEQIREHERFLKNQREYQAWHKKFDNAMVPEDAREDMVDTTSSPPNPELANTSYNQALPSNDADDSPLTRNNPPPSSSSVNEKFGYDGNGHRVSVIKNGKKTIEAHDRDGKLMAKIDESTGIETDYIWLGDEKVVAIKSKEGQQQSVTYFHNNLLGSPLVGTDEKGNKKWDENYKPYGSELIKNAGRDNPHVGYTGKEFDADTGLSYYGARFYDPGIGRFISPDPAPIAPINPMTFNRYAYANDNPYRYKDKDGKVPTPSVTFDAGETGVGLVLGGLEGWSEGKTISDKVTDAIIGGVVGGAVGFAANPLGARASTSLALTGLRAAAVRNGVALGFGTGAWGLGNKAITGNYNWGGALINSFGARLARMMTTFNASMKGVPKAGRALINAHTGLADYSVTKAGHGVLESHTSSSAGKNTGAHHGSSDDSHDSDSDSHSGHDNS